MVTYRYSHVFKGGNSILSSYTGGNLEQILCKEGALIKEEARVHALLKGVPGIVEIVEEGMFINEKGEEVIPGKHCLFMQRYDGDLFELLAARRSGDIAWTMCTPFVLRSVLHHMVRLLTTLEIMHSLNICHNDIKTPNIFYDVEEKLYLGDFDLCREYTQEEMERFFAAKQDYKDGVERDYVSELSLAYKPGTFVFAAPEAFSYTGSYYDRSGPVYPISDIWSLGCIFFDMLTPSKFNATTFHLTNEGKSFSSKYYEIQDKTTLGFLNLITEDMNREGFEIYDKEWKDKLSEENNKDRLSPIKALLSYQKSTRGGKYALDDDSMKHLRTLFTGMLDPNFLTRLSATECLQNPLFKDHLHISESMWKEFKARKLP